MGRPVVAVFFGAIWIMALCAAGCSKYGSDTAASPTPSAKQQLQYARDARSDAGRLANAQDLLKRSPEELKPLIPELKQAVSEKNYPQVTTVLKQVLQKAEGGGGS